jgi:hypothetical protein
VSIVAVAAFALLLTRPRSAGVWVFAALAQIADALFTAVTRNDIQMSWTIVAALHVAILLTLASVWNRPPKERAQAALDLLTPSIRGVVLVVYFYAVLHKLNSTYFSSLNVKPGEMLDRMPLLGHFAYGGYAAHVGLALELLAFGLLLVPRLRLLGVLTAFGLHFGLGWIGFRQFTIMFPLLLLFLLPSPGRVPHLPERLHRVLPWVAVPGMVVYLNWNETAPVGEEFLTFLFALAAIAFSIDVARRVWAHGVFGAGRTRLFAGPRIGLLAPVLFAAWCFMPYLGITTHPCMTMYSHLSVHSGRTNHFFVPASLQIDAIQDDLVEIIETSSPRKYPMGAKMPRLALRKLIHVDRLRGKAPRRVVWRTDTGEMTALRGRLPNPSIWERLPMISFNGPSALRTIRIARRTAPRLMRQTPVRALGDRPTPEPRGDP